MSFEDFHIDLFQDYLETLCKRNKLVAHEKLVNNKTQRTFSRFESEEHIRAITSTGGKNIVIVADYYGQRTGDPDDKRMRNTVQVRFCCKKTAGTHNETDAISAAIALAETIMFQFINMMEKDFAAGCNALEALEPDAMTWNPINDQPWLNDFYGWDLNVPFKSYLPEHDEDNWEAE